MTLDSQSIILHYKSYPKRKERGTHKRVISQRMRLLTVRVVNVTEPKYVGMTQITQEQAELMTQNYTEYQKINEKVKEIMSEIEKDKVLDAVSELENKIDDLSQHCCLASYEVEDTLHDLQLCIDKIKTYVENKNE